MKRAWLVLLPLAVGCGFTDIGDQYCTEDSKYTDKGDECPYGPGGEGPKRKEITDDNACKDVPDFAAAPAVCPSFGDVWTRLIATDGGRCAAAGCHTGAKLGKGLELPADRPSDAYAALSSYERDGRPYFRASDDPRGGAEKAWVLCNLQAKLGGYSPMPVPGGLTGPKKAADLELVRDWVNCGMLELGGTGGGGAVGGGGGEGVGGQGGAGGG